MILLAANRCKCSSVNVTCDWLATGAATTQTVCGVLKRRAVYLTEFSSFHFSNAFVYKSLMRGGATGALYATERCQLHDGC